MNSTYPQECPFKVALPKSECPQENPTKATPSNTTPTKATPTNTCWSPGTLDVDCVIEETGEFGLCCFDGCQNTCLKKTCETVNETKIDFVEQQKCSDDVRVECKNKPGTVLVIYRV